MINTITLLGFLLSCGAGAQTATTAPTTAPVVASTPSINPAAQAGQSSQNSGALINGIASAALIKACLDHHPHPAYYLCAMGAMAAQQAGADSSAAGQSGNTMGMSSTTSSVGTPGAATSDAAAPSGFSPDVKAGMKAMTDAGYTLTPTGVKNPDGSVTPSSAFNSSGAMAAAGIDKPTIDLAQKVLAEINGKDGPRISSLAVAEGGGSGGSSAPEPNYDDDSNAKVRKNPFAMNAGDRKQLVAGKTITFDGEPIGVKGLNIFDMVHVAYQKKRTGNQFIESSGSAAVGFTQTRGPASASAARTIVQPIAKPR